MIDPQATPAGQPLGGPPVDVDVTEEDQEPTAVTAGEEDHRNPDTYRGDDADAPADTGKPPQDS